MKIAVDFSIFTEEGAFGQVSGDLDMVVMPEIGDSISFLFADNGVVLDSNVKFCGILKVTDRIIAMRKGGSLAIALSDVVVPTKDDAIKLMQYFESAFDLFGQQYDNT